jgi:adhesin/invasin
MNGRNRFNLILGAAVLLVLSFLLFTGCSPSGNIDPTGDTDFIIDSIWADQTTIVAGNFTNIYVLIKGATTGLPIKNIPVSFTTSRDSIINPEPITNAEGVAMTTFITEPDSSGTFTATITAKVTAEQERIKRITITILPTNFTNPGYVFLTAVPDTVYADGTSSVLLTARVVDSLYTPLKNKTVTFRFLQGNQGDLFLNFVGGAPITGDNGIVSATFTVPGDPRVIIISAAVAGTADSIVDTATIWVLEIPDVDFIDLSATPTSIPADGASELVLSAYVTIGGTGAPAPDGTEIYFTSAAGALLPYAGSKYSMSRVQPGKGDKVDSRVPPSRNLTASTSPLSSITAYTESGYARVRLRSSTTAGRIQCTASATVAAGTISDTTYVNFLAGSPYTILVTAERDRIMADGIDTTKITARVFDDYGNPVTSGYTVTFATDKGGVFPLSSMTDSLGRATTTLTSGTISGYARVTATCGSAFGYTEVLLMNTIPRYIQLSATPTSLPADGISQSIILAEVLDSAYTPVTDGVRIKFFTDLGSLSGVGFERATPLLTNKNRNIFTMDLREAATSGGFCSVLLTSGFVADSCMVAAWFQTFDTLLADTVITAADTIYIPFLAGDPARLVVSFSKDSIRADEQDTCTVFADVYDAYNNLVGPGRSVLFTPDVGGGTVNPVSSNTNAIGRAQTKLTSSRVTGWHTMNATFPGAMAGNADIYFYPVYPQELRMVAAFDSATANGADSVLIEVYVSDAAHNPCSDGIPVRFRTEMGTFLPYGARTRPAQIASPTKNGFDGKLAVKTSANADVRGRIDPRAQHRDSGMIPDFLAPMADSFTTTTVDGYARIYLIAPTTACTTFVWGEVAVSDTETAIDSMIVVFKPDIPRMIHLSANPGTIPADSSSTTKITALVTDAHGNPVGDGWTVEFELETGSEHMGTILRPTINTNIESACTTTMRSRYVSGEAVVVARLSTYPSVFNNIGIWITGSSPGFMYLTTDSVHLPRSGSTAIQAEVFDGTGYYISDGTLVNFSVEPPGMGIVAPAIVPTSGGLSGAVFTAGTTSGIATIIATAGAIADTKYVFIGEVPAGLVILTLDSTRLAPLSTMGVRAEVFDSAGYPISDGTPVIFTVDPPEIGRVVPPTRNTTDGEAYAQFRADTASGIAMVIATVGAIADTKFVYVGESPAGLVLLTLDSLRVAPSSSMGIRAEVFDSVGYHISDGTPVNFTVEPPEIGIVVPPTVNTLDGISFAEFRSDTLRGSGLIIATVGAVADTKIVHVGSLPVEYVFLSIDSTSIRIGNTMSVRATVIDSSGAYVSDGTLVSIRVEPAFMADIVPPRPATLGGIATAEFRPDTLAASCVVIATVGSVADTKTVQIKPGPVENIILTAIPDTLLSVGGERSDVVAQCFDAFGNAVENGRNVIFEAIPDTMGSIISPMATESGYARTTFTSGTIVGRVVIRASIDGAVATYPIEIVPTGPAYIVLTSDSIKITVGTSTRLRASVFDASGRPISDDTRVDFRAARGEIDPPFGFTVDGFTTSQLFATTVALVDTIIASADSGAIADTVFVHYVADCPVYIYIDSLVPDTLFADGRSRSRVYATVRDVYLNFARPGTPILLKPNSDIPIAAGFITSPAIVDSQGQFMAIYRASNDVGPAIMEAFFANGNDVDDDFGSWQLPFYPTYDLNQVTAHAIFEVEQIPPIASFMNVTAYPNRVLADGSSYSTVMASAYDSTGSPVADGTIISFRTENILDGSRVGDIPSVAFTYGGSATVNWISPTTTAKAYVYGSIFGLEDSALVEFIPGIPSGVSIDVYPDSVPADGFSRATATATVRDEYGNPVPGVTVTFASAPIGTFIYTMGNTDSLGQVSVQLYSDMVGVTTVMASILSGAYVDYAELTFTQLVAAHIFMIADSAQLKADGTSSTTVRALVQDSSMIAVPDNTPIRFTTDLGFVFPGIAYTLDGEAKTTLRSATTVGVATITGDAGDSVTGTTTVNFVPGPPATIEVVAIPTSIPANGDTFTQILVTVRDINGNTVNAGVPINFTTTLGTIDTLTYTNTLGEATVFLFAGITPGTAVIWATSGTAIGQTTVNFMNTDAAYLYLYVDPDEIIANGRDTARVWGRVTNAIGTPVSDGTPIMITVTTDSAGPYGAVAPVTAHTDSGLFEAIFTANRNIGTAYIVGNAGSGVVESVMVELLPGPPDSILVVPSDSVLPADSFSTTNVHVEIFDRFANPVGSGIEVTFETNRGWINPTLETTNSSGHADVIFTAGRRPGEARVRARAGTATGEAYIILENSEARYVTLTSDISSIIADALSTTFLRALVSDSVGMPVSDGTPVFFYIDTLTGSPSDTGMAMLSPTLAFTVAGEAAVQVRSKTNTGRVWFTACTSDSATTTCGSTFIDMVPGPVDSIRAWAEETSLIANGVDFTIVHAVLYDRYGNTVGSGVPVSFSVSGASISPATSWTNSAGEVTTVLTASNTPTVARVNITAGGIHTVVTVDIGISPPAYLSLRADPRRIAADGESFSTITARVLNELGMPVSDGQIVVFHSVDSTGAPLGTIDTLETTVNGEAVVRLYSEPRTGTAWVSARVGTTLSDTINVWFTPGPPHRVEVIPEYPILTADGVSTSACTIRVMDVFDNLVEAGTRVNLSVGPSASLGSLIPPYTYTNNNAPSVVTFRAGVSTGVAVISAEITGGPAGAGLIELRPLEVSRINVFADSLRLTANGTNSTAVHAYALNDSGHAVSDSTPLYFYCSGGTVFPGVGYTSGGEAVVLLRSPSRSNSIPDTIIAYVGNPWDPLDTTAIADTTFITFVPGAPYMINVTPSVAGLVADGIEICTVRAVVYDAQGNRVENGKIVRFEASLGTIDTLAVTVMDTIADSSGVATVQLRSGTTPGTSVIMASCEGAIGIAVVDFVPYGIHSVFVRIDPDIIVADRHSRGTITGVVRDTLGNPIDYLTPVHIYPLPDGSGTNMGFVSPATVYTSGGNFETEFTSDTTAGICQIVAEVYVGADTVADTTWCELIPGAPHIIDIWPTPAFIPADSFSFATCSAYVYDRYRNTMTAGTPVTFEASMGILSRESDETNSRGLVLFDLMSTYTVGTARITARSGSARGDTFVEFTKSDSSVADISITVDQRILQADGFTETIVRAAVFDTAGGYVGDRTRVNFSMIPDGFPTAAPDTFGNLIPQVGFTSSGQATTRFRVKTVRGNVWIKAAVAAAVDSVRDSILVQILPGELAYIVLDPDTNVIAANGRANTSLTATLYDDFNNPLLSGHSIEFGTDLGSIYPGNTMTNSTGEGFTTLTAGTTPGTARVWARSGSAFDIVPITIRQSDVGYLLMTADPIVVIANGMSQSILKCDVYDTEGSPASDGTEVFFAVHPVDTGGTVVSPKLTFGGSCITNFTSSTDVGYGVVWVVGKVYTPGDSIVDSVSIFVHPGPAATIDIWGDTTHIPRDTLNADAWDNMYIYARVNDQYDNHLRAGEEVTFTTTLGSITATAITDTSGVARGVLTAGLTPGDAVLMARSGSAVGYGQINFRPTQISNIIVYSDSSTLTADGISSTRVRAHVYSPGGYLVSDRTLVNFVVPSGYAFAEPNEAYTDSGIAITMIRADTIAASDVQILAIAGTDTGIVTIRLNPGKANRIIAYAQDSVLYADGASVTTVACTVYDRFSNPVFPGTPVSFQTTLGTIISAGFTNTTGYAFSRLTAGTSAGDALVSIRCGDAIQFVDVRFDSLIADEIVMTVTPAILRGDGTSTALVRSWVYSGGLYVSDGTRVTFSQDTTGSYIRGIITPRIAFTSGGIVEAELTAPIGVGQSRIIASVGATVADSFIVSYQAGEPAIIVFDTLYPSTIPADGSGYPVIVHVYDEYMNPVNIGTAVTFETSRGSIISPVAVDSTSGSARTLISSSEAGPAFITARSGGAVASKPYQFTTLDADIISLVANPIRITADGVSTSNLLATVFNIDTLGRIRPVSDNTPVTFQTLGRGIVSPTTGYTVGGQVNSTLLSSVVAGYDTIIASVSATLADTAVVEFAPGPPTIVSFVPPIRDMNADGADTQMVTVAITDAFGNRVRAGLAVSFSITLGYITPNSATDSLGTARAVIVSGSEFGTASLSANCGTAWGYATVNFVPLQADTIYLVVDPPILTANGSAFANLTAVVLDSAGLPVSNGTIVKFTTSHGITNPVIAYTSGGIATSRLTAGTTPSDSVFVVASCGASVVDTSLARFIPGPPSVMYISASDSSIVANGADSTTIFVEVYDNYGNSVGTGVEVTFTSTLGTIVGTAYTDITGVARARLLAGNTAGFSNVRATAGSANTSMLIEFLPTDVGEVLLTVVPSRITADGVSTANVTCFVLDTLGLIVSDGTPVRFSGLGFGNISPIFATTVGGQVSATITSYTTVGWDTLIATSGGISDSVDMEFISGPPYYVKLWPIDSTLLSNETDTTRIYGVVYDEVGNRVNAGKIVNLSVNPATYGTITPVTATDDTGSFNIRFRAGRFSGVAVINATCEGATGITQIDLMPTTVAEIGLAIESRYMNADGVSSTNVTAFVTDSSGLQIADGTIVRFAQLVPPGNVNALIVPNRQNTTDGRAIVDLYAPSVAGSTYVYAYIPLGSDTVTSDTQSVYFNPGPPAVVRFDTSFVQLIANGSDTLADSAWVEDAFGNPVPGTPVNFTISMGSVSPPIAVTNGQGGVRFRLTAPNRVGSSYLTASSGSATGYLPVDFVPNAVDTIILTVTPRGLPADGASNADVRALVLDSSGNPIADSVMVRFTSKLGLITPFDYLSGGIATAILTAADTSGADTIRAICLSETSIVVVNYAAGPPADIELTVVPDTATVGSSTSSLVSGTVLDASGNPVAAGTYVYLSVDSAGTGSIADPIIPVDSAGYFATFFTPGLKAGMTGITAVSGAAIAQQDFLIKAGPPHTMDITVSRDFIYIRGVGEIDQSVIQAVIFDQYDNPVRDSSEVTFRVVEYPTGGSINPQLIPGGGLISSPVFTINGGASVTLRSGDRSGAVVVEARAVVSVGDTIISRAPRVTVGSGLPYHVSVSVGKCNIGGWLVDGLSNPVMAIVTDEYDNPVAPGTSVWFTALQGAITTSAVTNDSGFAFATWYSANPRSNSAPPPAPWANEPGLVTIVAETRDAAVTRADTVQFFNSGPPITMTVSTSPTAVVADETGVSEATVVLEDINSHPVVDNTSINLFTTWGTIETPIVTTNECAVSFATAGYTARTLNEDDACGAIRGGVALINAISGSSSASDSVVLNHGLPRASNSIITAPSEAPWNFNYVVGFQVLDVFGNPICGESVRLTPAMATLVDAAIKVSSATGECSWTLTAPDSTGPALDILSFEITSTGGVKSTSITYTSGRRRPYYAPADSDTIPETPLSAIVPEQEFFFDKEKMDQWLRAVKQSRGID